MIVHLLLGAMPAGAANLVVDSASSVPGTFAHVQDAVNAAANGDVITVLPGVSGVYQESVDLLGKDLAIEGTGCGNVTLYGISGPTLTIHQSAAAGIRQLTIQAEDTFVGADVDDSYATFEDVCFVDLGNGTVLTAGAGINAFHSSLQLLRVLFQGNEARAGGALFVNNLASNHIDIDDSEFVSNYARMGNGGAISLTGGTLDIDVDTHFVLNKATAHGGGIYATNYVKATIAAALEQNIAVVNGGGLFSGAGALTLDGSTFTRNEAANGGGMYLAAGAPVLIGVDLVENFASGGGGGMNLGPNVSVATLTQTNFFRNTSNQNGGGLGGANVALDITGGTFDGNTASSYGGGIYRDAAGDVTLTGVTFAQNEAGRGGGVFVDTHNAANTDAITISACRFEDNAATDLGGLSEGGAAVITRMGDVVIKATTFVRNKANSPTTSRHGGALRLVNNDTIRATDNFFCSNAAARGSAVATQSTSLFDIWQNNVFANNDATIGGALFFNQGQGLDFSYNTLAGSAGASGSAMLYFTVPGSTVVTDSNLFAYDDVTNSAGGRIAAETTASTVEVVAGWGDNACWSPPPVPNDFSSAFSSPPTCFSDPQPPLASDPRGLDCGALSQADFETTGAYLPYGADPYSIPIP